MKQVKFVPWQVLLLFAVLVGPSLAEGPKGGGPKKEGPKGDGQKKEMQKGKGPCVADLQKFCAGVQKGQGRLGQCLKQNEAKLEPSCKAKLQQRQDQGRARMKQVHASCKAEVKQFCAATKPGQGRVLQCLKQNEGQLGAACKAAMQPKPAPAGDAIPEEILPQE